MLSRIAIASALLVAACGGAANAPQPAVSTAPAASERMLVEEFINLLHVAILPEVHYPVDAIDQRHGLSFGRFVPHALIAPLIPGFQFYLAAAATLFLGLVIVGLVRFVALLVVVEG